MARKYHRRDVLEALVSFVETYDKMPTAKGLNKAPRKFFPSYGTVLRHFGSLAIAKRSLLAELGKRGKFGVQKKLPI